MISQSLKEEVLNGDWFCSKCNKQCSYKKSTIELEIGGQRIAI